MPSRQPPRTEFDLGPPLANRPANSPAVDVRISDITAPSWIDHSSMYYRLAYRSAANPLPYAHSEWVMSPAALLTQRLRSSLSDSSDGTIREVGTRVANVYTLRSELAEFEQVFDQPDRSHGVIRLRVTLEGEGVWAQRTFVVEKPAPSANATGGVSALTECSDELATSIAAWLAGVQSNTPILKSALRGP
ncbi:MAG: membrane integrity-associated transporter subunit PqiC [Sinobacteraceae bacterium]|nr:membrane integrity-associated transporter subunit PqiC [Nevskiaceae bacterium]